MQIHLNGKNKKFELALEFVQRNYPHLFHERLHSITLTQSPDRAWLGLHTNYPETKNSEGQIVCNAFSEIMIANGNHRVQDFIETLVHELVHVWQWSSGRMESLTKKQREDEACATSYLAYKKYAEDNGIPISQ